MANQDSPDALAVSFNDQSNDPDGSIVAWSWDFGDGSSSTQQNPTHTYATAGSYTVKLTVTDDRQAQSTVANRHRHRAAAMRFAQLGGVLAVAALAAAVSAVPAAAAVRPRLEGRFAVTGVVTATKGYTGDHKGRQIRNTYIFTPSANCARFAPCDRVKLSARKSPARPCPGPRRCSSGRGATRTPAG